MRSRAATVSNPIPDPHATIDLAEGTRSTGGGSGDSSAIRIAPAEVRTTRLPYDLVEELGRGGMGTVMKAVDTALRREVAVKLLTRTGDDRRRDRFLAEAQITGQLEHPGIVPVHGFGTAADGRPWFAMKLVRGRTLGEIIAARAVDPGTARAWPVRRLLAVLVQAAQAVAFAHSRGVVHRDLKPANIMLGDFGEVLVMDWGLARMQGGGTDGAGAAGLDAAPEVSMDGTVCGTPCYMPPEQARGERDRIGPGSDVFALGATLCEVLSGRPPLTGSTASSVVRRAARGEAEVPLRDWQDRPLAGALVSICRRALAPEPGDRYPGALAFAADLQAFLDDRGVEAHAAGWWEDAARAVRRHRAVAAVALVAGLLIAASLGLGYLAERRARAQAESERVRAEVALADAERRRADAEQGRRRERMLVQGARTQAWLVERGRAAAAAAQAAAGLTAERPDRVRAALDAVPGEARDWIWRHLDARAGGAAPVRRIVAGAGTLVPAADGVVLVEDDGGVRLVGLRGER
ncbi:MAG: Serine/threonine-protein kinase PknD, partial [Planctomycetota bacterium]